MHDVIFSFRKSSAWTSMGHWICICIKDSWILKKNKKGSFEWRIVTQSILFSIHEHSCKHAMHLFDIAGKVKNQRRKSTVFPDKPSFLKRITRSIVARINIQFWKPATVFRINIQFWKPAIPFGSINPESRIFLRFRSGASTRSLVFFYDSVREHQPGVSYFLMISLGSVNPESRIFFSFYDFVREYQPGVSYFSYDSIRHVTIFRIKVLEENSKKNYLQ